MKTNKINSTLSYDIYQRTDGNKTEYSVVPVGNEPDGFTSSISSLSKQFDVSIDLFNPITVRSIAVYSIIDREIVGFYPTIRSIAADIKEITENDSGAISRCIHQELMQVKGYIFTRIRACSGADEGRRLAMDNIYQVLPYYLMYRAYNEKFMLPKEVRIQICEMLR